MRKILLFISMIVLASCSTPHYFTSDSDAFLEYDRSKGRWQFIWTWKMKGGRVQRDTIPLIPKDSTAFPSPI